MLTTIMDSGYTKTWKLGEAFNEQLLSLLVNFNLKKKLLGMKT